MNNLSPINITRIKNVTNKETGEAYLNLTENNFELHWPDSRRGNILEAKEDEIIVLYQKIRNKKYFTHLVIPSDNKELPEGKRHNYRFGRTVKVVAFTGIENAIPFKNTLLDELNFHNRGWGSATELSVIKGSNKIEKYQIELWNKFSPFFNNEYGTNSTTYSYLSKELIIENEEKTAEEGNLKIVNHIIRERNQKIIDLKKKIEIRSNTYFCEVCGFSFIDTYNQEYLECHHNIPISMGVRTTELKDLKLVCSNCHRMLHRKIDEIYLSIEELRELIKTRQNSKS